MSTEAQKRASAKYQKQHVKQVCLKFSPVEQELYEWVRAHGSASGYIKELIRKDMQKDS